MSTITLPSGAVLKSGPVTLRSVSKITGEKKYKRDADFFEKDNHTFKVPTMDKNFKEITTRNQKSIITNIDNTMEKFYELIPSTAIDVKSWCWYSEAEGLIKCSDNGLLEAVQEKYDNETIQRKRLSRAKIDGNLITLKYSGSGKVYTYVNATFKKLVDSILPKSEHIKKSVHSYDEFARVIDKVIIAMDELFINEGLEATTQNRSNLISLVYNMSALIKKNKKVKTFLGVESEINDVKNKSLIHAAANGYNSGYVKLFYVQNSFPKEVEDFKALTALPPNILVSILSGK